MGIEPLVVTKPRILGERRQSTGEIRTITIEPTDQQPARQLEVSVVCPAGSASETSDISFGPEMPIQPQDGAVSEIAEESDATTTGSLQEEMTGGDGAKLTTVAEGDQEARLGASSKLRQEPTAGGEAKLKTVAEGGQGAGLGASSKLREEPTAGVETKLKTGMEMSLGTISGTAITTSPRSTSGTEQDEQSRATSPLKEARTCQPLFIVHKRPKAEAFSEVIRPGGQNPHDQSDDTKQSESRVRCLCRISRQYH